MDLTESEHASSGEQEELEENSPQHNWILQPVCPIALTQWQQNLIRTHLEPLASVSRDILFFLNQLRKLDQMYHLAQAEATKAEQAKSVMRYVFNL